MREIVSPLSGIRSPFGVRRISGPQILLSAASIAENASVGSTVGVLSVVNGTGTWTFTETADPDNKFVLAGTNNSNLNLSAAVDFETATSHSVTVEATNGTDTISRTFSITVTNVFEAATLNALGGTFTLAEGAPQGTSAGTLTGRATGSTLSLIDNAGGRVQLSGTTIQAGPTATDFEAATSHSFTVRETLADSANSPRDTVLTLNVTDITEGTLSGVTFTQTKVGVNEAPQSVEFAATALGISDQASAVIVWDFGDDYQFRYLPEDTKANDRQSGTAIGHRAAHVYRTPGTYTVTCTAYEFTASGIASVSTTQDVVIEAADPAITSRVAISRNGDFTGAPAGATQQTWTGAEGNFTFQPNTAYYFQAGQTFERGFNAVNFTGGGVLKLHRYGAGAHPILNNSGFTMWGSNHGNTTIAEVEFLGTFDVDQNPNWEDTGVYPTPPPAPPENGIFVINGNGGQTVLVYGVRVSGYQLNYYYQNNNTTTITHTVDCESTNWWNYGALSGNDGSEAWVGCHFHQKIGSQGLPDEIPQSAFPWNSPGAQNTPRSGPLRIGESNPVLVNKCRFLAYRSGWSATIQPNVASIQPAIRLGSGTTATAENAVLSQSDMIGGATVLSASIQNTSTAQSAIGLYNIEFNYLAQGLDGEASEFIGTTKPGMHVRGNVFEYVTGIPVANTVGTQIRVVGANGALSFGANAESFVYGNTLVANGNTPGVNWQSVTQIGAGTRPITYQNNLFQMNGTFDSAGSGALFQTDWSPLESNFPFAPITGSPAFGGYTTGRLPALTQGGSVRTSPFSIGASEEGAAPPSGAVVSSATVTPTRINVSGQDYDVYRFLSSGSITFSSGGDVEYLIVGGGGGGGVGVFGLSAAGGGAGGLLAGTSTVAAATLPVTVGAGGAAGVAGFGNANSGGDGGNSSFNSLTAIGGGGGAGGPDFGQPNGRDGGSGGGGYSTAAAGSGTVGQGNAGGTRGTGAEGQAAGGGGGAGAVGQDGVPGRGGDGGAGFSSSITGTAVSYAGGGGGARDAVGGAGGGGSSGTDSTNGTAGAANTGGGGGGAKDGNTPGAGGSGIVIVRVPV